MAELTFTSTVDHFGDLRRWWLRGPNGVLQFEIAHAAGIITQSVHAHAVVPPVGCELEPCELCGQCWHDALSGERARKLRERWEGAGFDDDVIREHLERWYHELFSSPVPVDEGLEVSGDEVGLTSGGLESGQNAATGADDIAVPSAPVAAQPTCGVRAVGSNAPDWECARPTGHPGLHVTATGGAWGSNTFRSPDFTLTTRAESALRPGSEGGEPVPVAAHYQTAGWAGGSGDCGVECACGTTFDHFGTIAEAAALLDDHIAAAERDAEVRKLEAAVERAQTTPVAASEAESYGPVPVAAQPLKTGFVHPLLHINAVEQRPGIEPCFDCGRPMDDNYTEPNRCAVCHAKHAQEPVPVAARWDPSSPQWAVIRAAIAWRRMWTQPLTPGPADAALIEAVDALPHIGEAASVAAQPPVPQRFVGVEYAYAEGYRGAVARLRDDERYRTWWTSGLMRSEVHHRIRHHLADYLETVGPDGPDVTAPEPSWGSGPLVVHNPETPGAAASNGYDLDDWCCVIAKATDGTDHTAICPSGGAR